MKEKIITQDDIEAIKLTINEKTGLIFSEDKNLDIKQSIILTLEKFGIPSVEDLLNDPSLFSFTSSEYRFLIENLTINETYFFRHFSTLKRFILPRLVESNHSKKLKIWSAGCSSGEEAYSISMVLHELIANIKDWNICIKATDIDQHVISMAEKGIYRHWSMRSLDQYYQNKYFTQSGANLFVIKSKIKDIVDISLHNLKVNNYPLILSNTDKLDMIICRNVTIYFDKKTTIEIVNRFHKCLKDGGYLIVGHSEPSPFIYEKFDYEILGDMVVYKKNRKKKEKIEQIFINEKENLRREVGNSKLLKVEQLNLLTKKNVNRIEEIELTVDAAYQLYKKYDYKRAIESLDKIIKQNPNNVKANYLAALIYANMHQFEKSKIFLKLVIKFDSLYQNAYYLLSLMAKEDKDYEIAIDYLKKTLYINSEFILAYYELIMNYVMLKNISEAKRVFLQIKKLICKKNDTDNIGVVEYLEIKDLKRLIVNFLDKVEF